MGWEADVTRLRCPAVKVPAFGHQAKEQGLILQHWAAKACVLSCCVCSEWQQRCRISVVWLLAPSGGWKHQMWFTSPLWPRTSPCCFGYSTAVLICRSPPAKFLNAGSCGALLQNLKEWGRHNSDGSVTFIVLPCATTVAATAQQCQQVGQKATQEEVCKCFSECLHLLSSDDLKKIFYRFIKEEKGVRRDWTGTG